MHAIGACAVQASSLIPRLTRSQAFSGTVIFHLMRVVSLVKIARFDSPLIVASMTSKDSGFGRRSIAVGIL
jgi:hypothetical protein